MRVKIYAGLHVVWGRLVTPVTTYATRLRLWLNGVEGADALRVRGWVNLHIHHQAAVRIGRDGRWKSGFADNPAGGYRRLGIWVARNGQLTIGNNVGMSNATIMCAESVTIEDDVFIGGGVNIYDTDFHSIDPEARLARPDKTVRTGAITIGRRTFIGAHSIILKGVTIGECAVVGAGAVVTKDIPDNEMWAGNPARQIKKLNAKPTSECTNA